jgi:hypothetical protein
VVTCCLRSENGITAIPAGGIVEQFDRDLNRLRVDAVVRGRDRVVKKSEAVRRELKGRRRGEESRGARRERFCGDASPTKLRPLN